MRKGQYTLGHKWVYFIVAIFLLSFMFLFLRSMFQEYQVQKTDCVDPLLNEIIVAKILYAPGCFVAYDEELGRAMPGIIDSKKLTQENYENCFKYIDKRVKITLGDKSIGEEIESLVTISKPVFILQDGSLTPASMNIIMEATAC